MRKLRELSASAQDGFVGGEDESRILAYLDQVRARGDGGDGRFFHRRMMQDAAHLHVVGDDEAAEAELVPEGAVDPEGRDGCGEGLRIGLAEGLRDRRRARP